MLAPPRLPHAAAASEERLCCPPAASRRPAAERHVCMDGSARSVCACGSLKVQYRDAPKPCRPPAATLLPQPGSVRAQSKYAITPR